MLRIELSELQTRVVAIIALFIGRQLRRSIPALSKLDIPNAVGGFPGFGLASMPVAMGTMDEVAKRYGPSPKAFLLVTLAGSFFVDLANAVIAKGFLSLPLFAIAPATAG